MENEANNTEEEQGLPVAGEHVIEEEPSADLQAAPSDDGQQTQQSEESDEEPQEDPQVEPQEDPQVEPQEDPQEDPHEEPPASQAAVIDAPNDPFAPPAQPEEGATIAAAAATLPVIGPDGTPTEGAGDAEEGESKKPVEGKAKKKRHIGRSLLVTLLVIVVVVCAGFCGYLAYDDSQNASCHVPQGVTLDGTDVSGYSAAEVESVANKHVKEGAVGSSTLKVGDRSYTLNYVQLGTIDINATVKEVMGSIDSNMVNRCLNRAKELFGIADTPQPQAFTTVCNLSKKKVKARVNEIADECDAEAESAGYSFDTKKRKVVVTKAVTGLEVKVGKTVTAVMDAANTGATEVQAAVKTTKPKSTKIGQCIFVDLQECHLYFYENGKVKKDYPCSPGKEGYSTPSGDWYLEYKDGAPTWVNPHSDWSASMPETIGPGASNPLGLRALAVSCGGGIYIHGTTNTGALGSLDSHGCVRLSNDNIVELYNLVKVGIPIFIH